MKKRNGGVKMGFLYFLEKLRFPILDEIMLLVTQFGEETAFLVAAIIAAVAGLLFQMGVFYIIAIISLLISFVIFSKARKYPSEER